MFIPKISVTVPTNSQSFTITDITPTASTGYDISGTYPYYPSSNAQWDKLTEIQLLGQTPTEYFFNPLTDRTSVSGTVLGTFTDGVYLVSQYLITDITGLAVLDYTIGGANKVLTKTGAGGLTPWTTVGAVPGLFANAYGISEATQDSTTLADINKIESVTSTTLTLEKAVTLTADDPFQLIFKVQLYVLVLNEGEKSFISDIGNLAVGALATGVKCNNETSGALLDRLLLKITAQAAMSCGQYSKAHNAAILFSSSSNTICEC